MSDDNKNTDKDSIEDAAWSWVTRQHENSNFDTPTQAEFTDWLTADPAHRQAYDRASHLWLLAGLLPPTNDIDTPDCEEPDADQPIL